MAHAQLNCYPDNYESWLFAALDLRAGDEIAEAMTTAMEKLHHSWVKQDGLAAGYFADSALLRAYTLYYMTINMPKLWFLLDRSPRVVAALSSRPALTIVDCGCGPGTMLWALLFYLQQRHPDALKNVKRLVGYEADANASQTAARLGASLTREWHCEHIQIDIRTAPWEQALGETADLMILGNVLIEGPGPADLRQCSADHVVMIEPGNRRGFHRLLACRNQLLDQGWTIQFPCPQADRCPMTAENWCHFHINRFILPFVQRMSAKANRRRAKHHFSSFVVSRHASATPANRWRVLSTVRKAHGSGIRHLCNGQHMGEVVLNRKAKHSGTKAFIDAKVGDLLQVEGEDVDARLAKDGRIRKSDKVENIQYPTRN